MTLYHCKASGVERPGSRIEDLYDVVGQAIKSSMWMRSELLLARLIHRVQLPSVRGYLKGDEQLAKAIIGARREIELEICVVQPGLRSSERSEQISHLLAAANHYVIHGGIDRFWVISS